MNLTDLVFEVDASFNKPIPKKVNNDLPKNTLRLLTLTEKKGIQFSQDLLDHLDLSNKQNNYISIIKSSKLFDNIKNTYLYNISAIILTNNTDVLKQNKYFISKTGIIRNERLHDIFSDYMYDEFIEGTDFLVEKISIKLLSDEKQSINAINLSVND